jgi:hypothetical protein
MLIRPGGGKSRFFKGWYMVLATASDGVGFLHSVLSNDDFYYFDAKRGTDTKIARNSKISGQFGAGFGQVVYVSDTRVAYITDVEYNKVAVLDWKSGKAQTVQLPERLSVMQLAPVHRHYSVRWRGSQGTFDSSPSRLLVRETPPELQHLLGGKPPKATQ